MDFVTSRAHILNNIETFQRALRTDDADVRQHAKQLLSKGRNFLWAVRNDGDIFCPSRFAGYVNNDIRRHVDARKRKVITGSATSSRLRGLLGADNKNDEAQSKYDEYRLANGLGRSKTSRTFWRIDRPIGYQDANVRHPDEIEPGAIREGHVRVVYVNRYERSSEARRICIEYYGYTCQVCRMNFKEVYGDIGAEFIHVHHLVPISEIGENYVVDGIKDLRPVCPNCHAMLHRTDEPGDLDALSHVLQNRE